MRPVTVCKPLDKVCALANEGVPFLSCALDGKGGTISACAVDKGVGVGECDM